MKQGKSTLLSLLLSLTMLTGCGSSVLLLAGCGVTYFNCTPLENILGKDADLVDFSYKIAENLANTAMPPIMPMDPNKPILVTTLADNTNLQQTTTLGRIIQEHVSSRFVQLGYTVREVKLEQQLHITPENGETMLTRDASKLNTEQQAQAIFVGTITRADRTLYISARLINPHNHNIIASDDYSLCVDGHIYAALGLNSGYDDMIREPERPFLNTIF